MPIGILKLRLHSAPPDFPDRFAAWPIGLLLSVRHTWGSMVFSLWPLWPFGPHTHEFILLLPGLFCQLDYLRCPQSTEKARKTSLTSSLLESG
jgi:hypothetical protein